MSIVIVCSTSNSILVVILNTFETCSIYDKRMVKPTHKQITDNLYGRMSKLKYKNMHNTSTAAFSS